MRNADLTKADIPAYIKDLDKSAKRLMSGDPKAAADVEDNEYYAKLKTKIYLALKDNPFSTASELGKVVGDYDNTHTINRKGGENETNKSNALS